MKRFNFTGRVRILKEDVHIQIKQNNKSIPTFNVVLDIDDYNFPHDGLMIIEAYQSTRWMRFDIGRVGLIQNNENLELSEFDDLHNLRFRIKVVNEETGQLCGLASGVHPFTIGEDILESQNSILPVRSEDLREYGVCWKLDFEGDDISLVIDKDLGGKISLFVPKYLNH